MHVSASRGSARFRAHQLKYDLGMVTSALVALAMLFVVWKDRVNREARATYWETMHPEVRPPKHVFMKEGCVGGLMVRELLPPLPSLPNLEPHQWLFIGLGGLAVIGIGVRIYCDFAALADGTLGQNVAA